MKGDEGNVMKGRGGSVKINVNDGKETKERRHIYCMGG